jgi:hypothetical protein
MIYEPNLSGEHEEVFGLFPWYLNGTLAETERQKVDEHVRVCAACREQLARERDIYRAMSAESSLEFIPASFSRLQARLDASEPAVRQSASRDGIPRRRGPMPWPRLAAASIAVLALGSLSLVSADRWAQIHALPSEYRTVTTPVARAPDEVIRAVFSPAITLVELQSILDEAQLRIISGPTEAGVYSLAANSDRPVTVSLSLLRRHASVRFAESTRVDPRGEPR